MSERDDVSVEHCQIVHEFRKLHLDIERLASDLVTRARKAERERDLWKRRWEELKKVITEEMERPPISKYSEEDFSMLMDSIEQEIK